MLSAGAIGSPHILLNSGIGSAYSLHSLGIKTIVDLLDVSEDFIDRPFNSVAFFVNDTNTFEKIRSGSQYSRARDSTLSRR